MQDSLKRIKELAEKLGAMAACNTIRQKLKVSEKQTYTTAEIYTLIDNVIGSTEIDFYKENTNSQ